MIWSIIYDIQSNRDDDYFWYLPNIIETFNKEKSNTIIIVIAISSFK